MSIKVISTHGGGSVEVDTSDEACLEFGFRAGDKIIFDGRQNGVVEGVGHPPCHISTEVLWVIIEPNDGAVWLSKNFCKLLKKVE
ncbi:MAG: hypothetical protein WC422_00640 [Candidatus Paceibacterota bacterium]|jgi:hypothetical protein